MGITRSLGSIFMPFLYLCLIGCAYGAVFKKRFSVALAPACILQILLMLLTGMLFGSITAGIVCGMVLAVAALIMRGVRADSFRSAVRTGRGVLADDPGLWIFLLLFVLIAILNTGKYFHMWDEFTHWGVFLKESLRTDRLYCVSDKPVGHGDYVPGIALFEVLWARLSFRYEEADAYRAIQMLQMSMLLPLASVNAKRDGGAIRYLLTICVRTAIIMGVPLIFHAFNFYHTIYQDAAVGITLFYCMWLAHTEKFGRYKLWTLTLALSMLLLTKQMAIAFLPTVLLYGMVRDRLFEKAELRRLVGYAFPTVIPLGIWSAYNRYAGVRAGAGSEGGQNYNGHGLSSFWNVLTHQTGLSWQSMFEKNYFHALFSGHAVVGKLPFVQTLFLLFLLFALCFWEKRKDGMARMRVFLSVLWFALTSVYYILLFWYLYLTAFGEFEATQLYSFERYMSTVGIAFVYLWLMVLFAEVLTRGERKQRICSLLLAAIFPLCALFARQGQLGAMLPGILRGETAEMGQEAEFLQERVPAEASVYVVSRGDRGYGGNVLQYACWPMTIEKASPGAEAFAGDIWSTDMTVREFVDAATQRDYLWLYQVDDIFIEKYAEAFEDQGVIQEGALYRIEKSGEKIQVADAEKERRS